jgi:arylsulfatase A-like enzyme
MMTGLYPTAVGVWNFHEMLDDRFITLAEVLRNQGFATAGFIGNPNAGPYAGVHQGFSLLVHQFAGRKQQSHERYLIRTIEDILSERLYEWLDEVKNRNFFLYVHLVDPHGAYDAPAPYDRWYQEKPEGEPVLDYDVRLDPLRVETPTADGRRRLYDGEIRYNDEYLAKFLEKLNERGLLRRTLVIFASDHGEFLGDRDADLWAHRPPGYVDVLHVPLMMVLPGTLPEGKRVPENVQLLDIMPTVLELAGVPTDSLLLQGDSLVSLMQGQELDFWRDRIVVSDEVIGRPHDDRRSWGSVFHRDLHYLNSRKFSDLAALANGSVDPRTTLKVFDLRRDPREQRDLGVGADTPLAPASVDFLGKLIARNTEMSEALTQDASETIELDPTIQDQLRGLGYLLEEDEETERP